MPSPMTSVTADQAKKEPGWAVVVALIGQRLAVPLVPLVTEPAIYVNVNELSSGNLGHRGGR